VIAVVPKLKRRIKRMTKLTDDKTLKSGWISLKCHGNGKFRRGHGMALVSPCAGAGRTGAAKV
jgi:hypothetical protein